MLGLSKLKALNLIEAKSAEIKVIAETIKLPSRTDVPERNKALQKEQSLLLESRRFTSLNFMIFLSLYMRYKLNPDYPADYAFSYLQAQQAKDSKFAGMD